MTTLLKSLCRAHGPLTRGVRSSIVIKAYSTTSLTPRTRRATLLQNQPAKFAGRSVRWRSEITSRTTGACIDNLWLRDNCRCAKCVNQDTMQRSFDTFSIPTDIKVRSMKEEPEGLSIKWESEDQEHDGHQSFYPRAWLQKHTEWYEKFRGEMINSPDVEPKALWTASIASQPPSVAYADVMKSDKGVGEWTEKIRKHGFCYVDGCPVTPEATKELLERIAFIRETHYGGFYDFTADLTMKDTAYTNLALPAHTDTTYFTDPAGLQMFHLLSHTEGQGGASLLVDGFQAAKTLCDEDPSAYMILSNIPVPAHAVGNEGITIRPPRSYPVLNDSNSNGHYGKDLLQIRWNNDDRGVVPLDNMYSTVGSWYDAASKFNTLLNSKELQYWAQLIPGRPLIFDNWRVLHGRAAFTGKRRICGGYINHEDYISRWRNTNFDRETVLQQIL